MGFRLQPGGQKERASVTGAALLLFHYFMNYYFTVTFSLF